MLIEYSGQDGFLITDPQQKLMWWKSIAFECGISPREFNNSKMSDIIEVMQIKSAVGMKKQRNKKVQDMMNSVRFK